jgi:hypothetical protein
MSVRHDAHSAGNPAPTRLLPGEQDRCVLQMRLVVLPFEVFIHWPDDVDDEDQQRAINARYFRWAPYIRHGTESLMPALVKLSDQSEHTNRGPDVRFGCCSIFAIQSPNLPLKSRGFRLEFELLRVVANNADFAVVKADGCLGLDLQRELDLRSLSPL